MLIPSSVAKITTLIPVNWNNVSKPSLSLVRLGMLNFGTIRFNFQQIHHDPESSRACKLGRVMYCSIRTYAIDMTWVTTIAYMQGHLPMVPLCTIHGLLYLMLWIMTVRIPRAEAPLVHSVWPSKTQRKDVAARSEIA